jgi:transcriptional regulator with XRE-family HTH domain
VTTPHLGKNVEALRVSAPKSKRLSRPQLAKALNLDRSTVTKWALGVAEPRDVRPIADVLGVSIAEVYAGKRNRRAA